MTDIPKLTSLAQCAGCAAKIRPGELAHVLRQLKTSKDPRALVGFATNDDAAVYQLSPTQAVVETIDFFPPVVDNPFDYGRIAAANALSDIWAMGAKPLFALNVVGFPNALPKSVLGEILRGGESAAREAGIAILGGHSIQDSEPKYGLAVTGVVHPKRILRNSGAKPGDVLILTKPLGTGIVTTALKRGGAPADVAANAVRWMSTLNRVAGEVFASRKFKVNALTDVTGFGLLGHLLEMMSGAKTAARLWMESIPLMEGVPALAAEGFIPGGTRGNLDFVRPHVRFPRGLPSDAEFVLADAQTNGGLLASVPEKDALKAVKALAAKDVHGYVIGQVVKGKPRIVVE